jgi:hypothetical protein
MIHGEILGLMDFYLLSTAIVFTKRETGKYFDIHCLVNRGYNDEIEIF